MRRLLLVVALAACGDGGMVGPNPDGAPPDAGGPITSADQLFSLQGVPVFGLTLSDEALASLAVAPLTYVHGEFAYEDTVIHDVGIRFKGYTSVEPIDQKPPFKIKFNEYVAGQRFLGLEGLTLNNFHQDASMMREHLSYLLFRAAGVVAPRTGYAEVYVNGDLFGLYLDLESIDDVFLANHFADPTGSLYEGTLGDDLYPSHVDRFEQDEGDDTSRADLLALTQAAQVPGDGIFYGDDQLLDTREFLAESAVEAVSGHWDGYWKAHNYRIYHEPTLDRWYFIPWGTDQTFDQHIDVYSGLGYLQRKCRGVPRCVVDSVHAMDDAVGLVDSLDLAGEIDRVAAVIDDAARRDPRKHFSNDRMDITRNKDRAYIAGRGAELAAPLDCLDGDVERDADGDGYGVCFADCNDGDAEIHPSAEELCDGIDNNCSDNVDDNAACPCPAARVGGVDFFFCDIRYRREQGATFCAAQGHVLARIDNQLENDLVASFAQSIRADGWWIGLHDEEEEGTFVWEDGAPVVYTSWEDGQPDNDGDHEDCAAIVEGGGGEWEDLGCRTVLPFVCREADDEGEKP